MMAIRRRFSLEHAPTPPRGGLARVQPFATRLDSRTGQRCFSASIEAAVHEHGRFSAKSGPHVQTSSLHKSRDSECRMVGGRKHGKDVVLPLHVPARLHRLGAAPSTHVHSTRVEERIHCRESYQRINRLHLAWSMWYGNKNNVPHRAACTSAQGSIQTWLVDATLFVCLFCAAPRLLGPGLRALILELAVVGVAGVGPRQMETVPMRSSGQASPCRAVFPWPRVENCPLTRSNWP